MTMVMKNIGSSMRFQCHDFGFRLYAD